MVGEFIHGVQDHRLNFILVLRSLVSCDTMLCQLLLNDQMAEVADDEEATGT